MEGNFKCFNHDFSTSKPEEWQKHIGEKEHQYTGAAECVTCGERVKLDRKGKLQNKMSPNVLCKGCKEQ